MMSLDVTINDSSSFLNNKAFENGVEELEGGGLVSIIHDRTDSANTVTLTGLTINILTVRNLPGSILYYNDKNEGNGTPTCTVTIDGGTFTDLTHEQADTTLFS